MSESTFLLAVIVGAAALAVGLGGLYWLIMRPSVERTPAPNEEVIIIEGMTEMEGEVLRGKLESLGIPSFLKTNISQADMGRLPVHGWKLFVLYANVEAARRALGFSGDGEDADRFDTDGGGSDVGSFDGGDGSGDGRSSG